MASGEMRDANHQQESASPQEIGQGLWMLCKKLSRSLYEELASEAKKLGFKSSEEDTFESSRQIVIANLWIISKTLSADRNILDFLHKIFIDGHARFAEGGKEKEHLTYLARNELTQVYQEYYQAWNDESGGSQLILSGLMLQRILNHGKPDKRLLNMMLVFTVNTHILGTMKSILNYRKDFVLKNTEAS